jgi:AraC family transcriptional regulator
VYGGSTVDWVDAATGHRQKLPLPATGAILSSGRIWTGVTLEHRKVLPVEVPEGYLLRHYIALQLSAPLSGEIYWPGKGWKRERLIPSSLMIVAARMPCAARTDGGGETLIMQLAPELLTSLASQASAGTIELQVESPTQDRLIEQAMLAMLEDLRRESPIGRLYGESLGMAIAAQLLQRFTVYKLGEGTDRSLSAHMVKIVVEYIEENIATDISLEDLAALTQMNTHSFFRSFKKAMGQTPHHYLLLRRIERAKSLLRDVTRPIAEIALLCGFGSQSHFATAFRQITKMSPRAYRNAAVR